MYAIFTAQKIYYLNKKNNLQLELNDIMEERSKLTAFASSISDGQITSDEIVNDFQNYDLYAQFNAGVEQYVSLNPFSAADENGNIIDVGTYLYGENATAEQQIQAQQYYYNALAEQYAKNIENQLSNMDNELELRQKNIETQISIVQSQYQAAEQAEASGIGNAAPKFGGVG